MHRQAHSHEIEPTPVTVHTGRVSLVGDLTVPEHPDGIIVFAHGSGSGRLSPRNRAVAAALVRDGFATLLFDLLTREEEIEERYTRHLRFDIALLAGRLTGAIDWVNSHRSVGDLPIGLFGASTGAAAALIAATRTDVDAVVSRGGRPDLAGAALPLVRWPTLFIVGGADPDVLELNRRAIRRMTTRASLHIVPNAGHLFEEPGALREVTEVASAWFRQYLMPAHAAPQPSPMR